MKKFLKIVFCLLFSLTAFGQERRDSIKSKLSLSVEGSGIYTYPSFFAIGTPKADLTFGCGVYGKFFLSKKINLIVGGTYDFLRYEDSFSETTISGVPFLRKDIYDYSIVSLSPRLNINIGMRKIFLNIEGGGNISLLVNNHRKIYLPDVYESKLFTNGSVFISGVFGIGINYRLTNHLIVYIQPEIVQSLLPLIYTYTTTLGDIQSKNNYLRYFKINTGITYCF